MSIHHNQRKGIIPLLFEIQISLVWFPSSLPYRSVLKVNEFTLAGAVLADSLGRGEDKKNGGEPTHSSPKSATFSNQYNTPATCLSEIASPLRARNDTAHHPKRTVRPGYTTPMQPTGEGELLSYSLCMKLSKFQVEDKSKTQRVHPCPALILSFLETKKAWS